MPRVEWIPAEVDADKFNFRALNAIANGLAPDEFRRISHLKTAMEVWKLLSITHEDTTIVKISKLQIYTA